MNWHSIDIPVSKGKDRKITWNVWPNQELNIDIARTPPNSEAPCLPWAFLLELRGLSCTPVP